MRKCIIALLAIIFAVNCFTYVYAADFTYDQIVDMIDAVSIDDVKMFSDGADGELSSNDRELFFTQLGLALSWMTDDNIGRIFFFDNNSSKMHLWQRVDINNVKHTFEILLPIVDPFINYKNGGKLTFFIYKHDNDFTNPICKLEYSPQIDKAHKTDSAMYNDYFSDFESFNASVIDWFDDYAFGEQGAGAVHEKTLLHKSTGDAFIPVQKGSKGDEVKKLQERLNELGYSVGKADGDFGNKTKSAIEEFQKDNGLEVTGIADEATQELLFSDEVNKKTNTESSSESKTNSDTVKAVASGIDYITDFALRTAPPVFSAFGSTDTCKVTEIYCQDKGNDVYHFTAKVKNGTSIIGFGEDLKITYSNGKANIEEVSSLNMYMDAGLNNIPGKMVWSTSDNGYDALLDAFKAIDINGDGHITKDEIFK